MSMDRGGIVVRGAVGLLAALKPLSIIPFVLALVVGCTDEITPSLEPNQSLLEKASIEGLQDTETQELFGGERSFVELSVIEPRFAGFFLEGPALVVNMTGLDRSETITTAIQEELLPEIQQRGRAHSGIEIRRVDYSFLELANWRNLFWRHVGGLDDLGSLDLDERLNRVSIGLKTGSGRARVLETLASLGIPAEGVLIHVEGTVEPTVLADKPGAGAPLPRTTYLYDRIRPIPRGVKFLWVNPSYTGGCTMGFNARRWPGGSNYFITASHCTYDLFDDDPSATKAVQAYGVDTVGVEAVDPNGWTCGPFWDRDECRYSDAAAYAYYAGVVDSVGFGTIARPEGPPGTGGSSGNVNIDPVRPRFNVTGSVNWPIQGDSVHKVGITTGWTAGKVTKTCYIQDFSETGPHPEYWVLCTYDTDYRAEGGDSGSPVFIRSDTANVLLAGVNFAKDDNYRGLFSSFGAIFHTSYDNLFQQVQVWNAPLTGSIAGPLEAPPEESCTWSASNVSGGAWPYSYQWSGALTGTGMNVTGEIQEPGEWLYLTVTDALSNQLNDQLYISVEDGMEECEY